MKTFLSFTFALGLVACGGGSNTGGGTVDLAGPHTQPSGDLAQKASTDMAVTGAMTGCRATIMCENDCVAQGNGPSAEQTCIDACDANETSSGTQLESTLKSCVQTACPVQAEDMGTTSPCAYDPSTQMLVDQTACVQCQMTAQSMGGACYAANQACNADM